MQRPLPAIKMKQAIESALSVIIGLSFTRTTRAANMECIKFGDKIATDKSGSFNIGLYALHLQCPWRIVSKNKLLIGSQDVYEPINEIKPGDDFDWEQIGQNLRDNKLEHFLKDVIWKVNNVTADEYGGLDIDFGDDVRLQIFPALSKKDQYSEYWRLLDHTQEESIHTVVGSFGIEIIGK